MTDPPSVAIPALGVFLAARSVVLDDSVWRAFGFRRRPRWNGAIFRPFMRAETRQIEPALFREIFVLSLAAGLRKARDHVTEGLHRELFVHVVDLAVLGPPRYDDYALDWWVGFRFRDPNSWGEYVVGRLARFLRTDGSSAALTEESCSKYPSEPLRIRWVSGFMLMHAAQILERIDLKLGHMHQLYSSGAVSYRLPNPAIEDATDIVADELSGDVFDE